MSSGEPSSNGKSPPTDKSDPINILVIYRNMARSLRNKYVDSIIDPANHVVDIPDDIMRLHTKRQETVTYNLSIADSGEGFIAVWPNNPTYVVGAHYTKDTTTGLYVFDRILQTAQDLGLHYDYGRKVSQILTAKSTTLPSGVYALNGTINVVRFEGTLSEIGTFDYDKILSTTTNFLDKKGNIPIGTGAAVLSLPQGFNNPYLRMSDPTPSATMNVGNVNNGDANLTYNINMGPIPITSVPAGTPVTLLTATFNVDILVGCHTQMSGALYLNVPGADNVEVEMQVRYLGISGNEVSQYKGGMVMGDSNYVRYSLGALTANLDGNVTTPREPIVAMEVTLVATNSQAGSSISSTGDISVIVNPENSSAVGYMSPTVIIAYQGAVPKSVLTVAGVSNYELIPNPGLQKNLELTYGDYIEHDLTYAKHLLSRRNEFKLRSVMDMGEYAQLVANSGVYSDYNVSAESFDFGSLLKGIKDIAAPAASMMFPEAAPLIMTGSKLLDGLFGSSASGPLYKARSASGPSYMASSNDSAANIARAMALAKEVTQKGTLPQNVHGLRRIRSAMSADTPLVGDDDSETEDDNQGLEGRYSWVNMITEDAQEVPKMREYAKKMAELVEKYDELRGLMVMDCPMLYPGAQLIDQAFSALKRMTNATQNMIDQLRSRRNNDLRNLSKEATSTTACVDNKAWVKRLYTDVKVKALSADEPIGDIVIDSMQRPPIGLLHEDPVLLDISQSGTAMFPVILTEDGRPIKNHPATPYVAIEVTSNILNNLPNLLSYPNYELGGRTIWNATPSTETGELQRPLHADYVLLPMIKLSGSNLLSMHDPIPVSGRSHQLAVYVADSRATNGPPGPPPSALYTGSVSGDYVGQVYGIPYKKALANELGLPIIGNSKGTIRVSTLSTLKHLPLPERTNIVSGLPGGISNNVVAKSLEDSR